MYPFNSQYTYDRHRPGDEINTKPSLTVPDQTMSLRTLLERYARGLPLDNMSVPVYDEPMDDDDFDPMPDWRKMDLADRQEWIRIHSDELAELNARIKPIKEPKPTTVVSEPKITVPDAPAAEPVP